MLFNLDTHRGLRDDTRETVASYRNDDCLMSQSQDVSQSRIVRFKDWKIASETLQKGFEIKTNIC